MHICPYTYNLRFEWDDDKAEANLKKHGVSFSDAVTVFEDSLAIVVPDPDHSHREQRLIIIGQASKALLVVVVYTERQDDLIRIISAREPTRRERIDYEKQEKG
jgi:uncharacterized DUF497 family protein